MNKCILSGFSSASILATFLFSNGVMAAPTLHYQCSIASAFSGSNPIAMSFDVEMASESISRKTFLMMNNLGNQNNYVTTAIRFYPSRSNTAGILGKERVQISFQVYEKDAIPARIQTDGIPLWNHAVRTKLITATFPTNTSAFAFGLPDVESTVASSSFVECTLN